MIIFIPGSVPSSKNSKVWTGKFLVHSKATQAYMSNTKFYWAKYRSEFQKAVKHMPKPLYIGFHFVRATRHKYDFINPLQTVQDLMVEYRWLEDDNMEEMIPFPITDTVNGKEVFTSYNKTKPGVYIKLLTELP